MSVLCLSDNLMRARGIIVAQMVKFRTQWTALLMWLHISKRQWNCQLTGTLWNQDTQASHYSFNHTGPWHFGYMFFTLSLLNILICTMEIMTVLILFATTVVVDVKLIIHIKRSEPCLAYIKYSFIITFYKFYKFGISRCISISYIGSVTENSKHFAMTFLCLTCVLYYICVSHSKVNKKLFLSISGTANLIYVTQIIILLSYWVLSRQFFQICLLDNSENMIMRLPLDVI